MRFHYGGFLVQSSRTLLGLSQCRTNDSESGLERLSISFAAAKPEKQGVPIFRWQGRYGLQLESSGSDYLFRTRVGASFLVQDQGRKIVCYTSDKQWESAANEAFVRRILPRIAILRGHAVIHAASLANDKNSVLLCGPSGVGKSTLSLFLQEKHGWKILHDDMSVLASKSARFETYFGSNSISLWQESRSELGALISSSRPIESYETKFRCEPRHTQLTPSKPLSTILFLESDSQNEEVRIQQINPMQVLRRLVAQQISFNPADKREGSIRFEQLAKIANQSEGFSLSYPREYNKLSDVALKIHKACRVGYHENNQTTLLPTAIPR